MKINILHTIEGAKEAKGLTVIIDVFRAFSVEAYIMNNGAEKLYAVGSEKTAYKLKEENNGILLIGERQGRMLPGFDYGNSPSEIKNISFEGKTIVHTTSAGTQGIVNAVNADEIITGSLLNAKAIAGYIKSKNPDEVSLVCMGFAGKIKSDEDLLCAEYIKSMLEGKSIDLIKRIDALKLTDGSKFFDPMQQDVYPEEDFYLSTEADKFGFVLKVSKFRDDIFKVEKITSESV